MIEPGKAAWLQTETPDRTDRPPDAACARALGDGRRHVDRASLAAGRAAAVRAGLFVSLSWLGVFRLLPEWARMGLVRPSVFGLATVAALLPLRLLRRPQPAEIDRRIERANRLDHAPVLTQTDRLSGAGRRCLRRRAVGRAPPPHGREGSTGWAATCRIRACPSAIPGRSAPWRRCFSSLPSPFPSARWAAASPMPSACPGRRRAGAAAHRCLGHAALLYRPRPRLSDLGSQSPARMSSPCRRAASLRCA
jgi:hypothetical protein